jgi:hypothetical protein
MARSPYLTVEASPFGTSGQRLRPRPDLPELEKSIFLAIVACHTAAHFRASDIHLLERYAECVSQARRLAEALRSIDVDDDRAARLEARLSNMLKMAATLSLRLHICPQSRSRLASKTEPAGLSYYEVMQLERAGDAGQD